MAECGIFWHTDGRSRVGLRFPNWSSGAMMRAGAGVPGGLTLASYRDTFDSKHGL
jgi:hypothetical protein